MTTKTLVNISITPNTLAELIESDSLHGVDFQCLDLASKKIVCELFLSCLKSKMNTYLNEEEAVPCPTDKQEVLLMAIEYLRIQYETLQNPCVALYISRYYRLLSLLNIASNIKESYAEHSQSWLNRHIKSPTYSLKLQNELNQYVQIEFNSAA